MHLALVDQALLAFVHELDGVFHRQDVLEAAVVHVVDHGRQGGGLAGAGGPGHQHDAAWLVGDILETGRRAQFLQAQDLGGDGTEYRSGAPVVVEGVDTETCQVGDFEGKVRLQEFLVILALLVVHDVVGELVHGLVIQRRDIDTTDVPVHPDHGRQAGGQMKVGGIVLDAKGE